jgi:hypothetical protein
MAEELDRIARVYTQFAEREARGRSPLYEEFAFAVAGSRRVLQFLFSLPAEKQQPNLLLAAVRYLHGTPTSGADFCAVVDGDAEAIAAVMIARRTQTNEPARCATLVPVLAGLPPPLALIEVGAAAGLCLLPDYYEYDYGDRVVPARMVTGNPPPRFVCRADAMTPVPEENVQVAWRAGIDIEPIDLEDCDSVAWLEALVWPGEGKRLERLRAAIAVARAHPPTVYRGDLAADLPALIDRAPLGATLVVFHTALLPYVSRERRAAFAELVRDRAVVWIANEAPSLQPEALGRLTAPVSPPSGEFLLSVDEQPVAWTDPHGATIEWLESGRPVAPSSK